MHFAIKGQRYAVAISARPLLIDGEPCRAKIDHRNHRIWLSDQVAKDERRRLLMHELRHAWVNAHGRKLDAEGDADDGGEMLDEVPRQYNEQGGDAVLESLEPVTTAVPQRGMGGSIMVVHAECGNCSARIAPGSIGTSKPEWSEDVGAWVIERGMLCLVCDQVTTWREQCTPAGMPLGHILPEPPPRVLTGADAGEWIARNPGACRVVSV